MIPELKRMIDRWNNLE